MFWEKKIREARRQIALLDADLSRHEEMTAAKLQRIEDQLRQMHERLDRMEGIR